MGQKPGDRRSQPSLELPSFPGFGRRRKKRGPVDDEPPVEVDPTPADIDPTPADVEATSELTTPLTDEPPVTHPTQTLATTEPQRRAERRTPRRAERAERTRRRLPGAVAAGLTGLLIGVAGGAGTYGALAGCEAIRGVSSCGGGPGFFLLLAILAVMVLVGAGLLRLLGVPAPGSTSFLAVGIMTVVVMLALLDVVYSRWMFGVVPTLGVVSYLVAHWVTTRFDAATPRRPDWT